MKQNSRKPAKTPKETTPISDGDTRPDQNSGRDPQEVADAAEKKTTDPFTVNRKRDINSLEDYKDAI
jgi:hypothetical protein